MRRVLDSVATEETRSPSSARRSEGVEAADTELGCSHVACGDLPDPMEHDEIGYAPSNDARSRQMTLVRRTVFFNVPATPTEV